MAPRATAIIAVLAASITALSLLAPQSASAAEGDRPGLAVMPLGRRGSVGNLAARRIEEYLRAMIEAGSVVRLIPASTVDSGTRARPKRRKLSKQESRAIKKLDKADQAAITGREMLQSGENAITALKLLTAAIKTYEKYFHELVDFTKLVDAYQRAAQAALGSGQKKRAALYVLRALTLQPSFVVDARKSNKQLQTIVTRMRARLAKRSFGVIIVEATRPNAEVYIDGVKLGHAPIESKDMAVGTHFVQVRVKGAKPWGKAVDIKKRKPIKLMAAMIMEYDPAHDIALMVKPDDVKPFANSGKYHERLFRNYGFMFARQIEARYLLFGAVSKSNRGIELHLFLYDAQIKRTAALRPVYFAGNLSDMQMKILEAEGHVRAAVSSFPTEKEVTELPEIYSRTRKSSGKVIAPPINNTVPARAGEPGQIPPRADEPPANPTPSVVRTTPKAAPTGPKTTVDPYAGLLKQADDDKPSSGGVLGRWWFWTGIGAVAIGGGVATYLLLTQEPALNPNFKVSAVLPPVN